MDDRRRLPSSALRAIARLTLVAAWLALAPACAALAAGVAAGPTIDFRGRPGVELDGNAGVGMIYLGAGYERTAPIDSLLLGLQATLGVERRGKAVPVSLALFLEYLRLGAPASPWGLHARLGVGFGSWNGGALTIGLAIGPLRLLAQPDTMIDPVPAVGCATRAAYGERIAHGVDLSFRFLVDRQLLGLGGRAGVSHFRLGLLYDLQVERFEQMACTP